MHEVIHGAAVGSNKKGKEMDKRKAKLIARSYVQRLGERYPVKKAFLFGSFARGTFHSDSDIDVAVVLGGEFDLFDTRLTLMRVRREFDSRIEPHPISEKEFNQDNPLVAEILHHGVPIDLK